MIQDSAHDSRLTLALRAMLHAQRVAALATASENGDPFVSMVPFAIEPAQGELVIHISQLAAHTGHLLSRSDVSMMVMQSEAVGEPVHALPRITLQGTARPLEPGSEAWRICRDVYLARFPEAEPMTQLGDFRFVAITVTQARHVAGFGAARSVDADEVRRVMRP